MLTFTRLPSSALRLTGADRLDFVQGQMTANLKAAPTPGMVPACFLSPKGQIEHFARIYRRADDVYLHLGAGEAAPLAARLRKYIIFDQVEVADISQQLSTLHLWDEAEAEGGLPGWDPAGADVQGFDLGGAVLAARVDRTGRTGLDVHYLTRHEDAVLAALGGRERSAAELEAARVHAGLPDAQADGWDGFLPQEVGLDAAVSYRKGCYVGQEIMARLEARGNTRYHLAQLEAATAAPLPARAEVTQGGKAVGRSGSSSGGEALARLRKDLGAQAALEVGGVPARLKRGAPGAGPEDGLPEHADVPTGS